MLIYTAIYAVPKRIEAEFMAYSAHGRHPHNDAGSEHAGCRCIAGDDPHAASSYCSLTRYEIEHLKLLIAKLQRIQFGRRSEKIERQIEQLELKLEELEANRSEQAPPREQTFESANTRCICKTRPARRPLPHIFRARPRRMSRATVLPRVRRHAEQAWRRRLGGA